jgi:tRNA (guanine-N7-)-methyltransferase
MRLRNIPGAEEAVAESEYCVNQPSEHKGTWSRDFFGGKPVRIEIGMGKGQFITQLAVRDSEAGFLGMERYSSVLLRGLQKMEAEGEKAPDNLKFLCFDAAEILDIFEDGELDKIYLNFSDPWPKDRHAKRRLTHHRFLDKYHQVLREDGVIEFKTDNQDLFTFSVEEFEQTPGWELEVVTRDLHHDEKLNEGNIMTEYEEKFSSKGNPICKLVAKRVEIK